ncbi:hypothetical protein BD309DRAFT_947987 [Dichomitus squalens]|nr:hypothetical protein BD309DRAFT_947987 [Dichomitus squalens]
MTLPCITLSPLAPFAFLTRSDASPVISVPAVTSPYPVKPSETLGRISGRFPVLFSDMQVDCPIIWRCCNAVERGCPAGTGRRP